MNLLQHALVQPPEYHRNYLRWCAWRTSWPFVGGRVVGYEESEREVAV